VYRLWRDGGYAIGALIAGVVADLLGVPWAIAGIAALTFASGLVVFARMYETLPGKRQVKENREIPGAGVIDEDSSGGEKRSTVRRRC
jgi:membrane protein implicated in regulation of membrane protease activity